MDDWVTWLQAKLGPMSFGTLAGFIMQIVIFRPPSWWIAAERALAAVLMATVFTKPASVILGAVAGNFLPGGLNALDAETMNTVAAALLALGGVELLRKFRKKVLKVSDADDS